MQERGKHSDELTRQKPLRLWPGVVAVVLQWLGMFGVPIVVREVTIFGVIGGVFGTLAVVVWWAFFSRAPRVERWGAVVMVVIALFATPRLLHESVATGNSGLQFFIYAIPILSLAFVIWAVASRRLADGPRRAAMVATILLACGVLTLVRSDGVTGDVAAEFAWRWGETAEERLLAQAGDELMRLPSHPDWNGDRSRLARPARSAPQRHHPRRTDRDRLDSLSAGGVVAPTDRTRRFFLRGPGRLPLHAGAARR